MLQNAFSNRPTSKSEWLYCLKFWEALNFTQKGVLELAPGKTHRGTLGLGYVAGRLRTESELYESALQVRLLTNKRFLTIYNVFRGPTFSGIPLSGIG